MQHDVKQLVEFRRGKNLYLLRLSIQLFKHLANRALQHFLLLAGKHGTQCRDAIHRVSALLHQLAAKTALARPVSANERQLAHIVQHIGLLAITLVWQLDIHRLLVFNPQI